MKHVSIIVPRGDTSLVNIAGTHQILTQVNGFLAGMGRADLFDVHLVGLDRPTPQSTGLFTVHPNAVIGAVPKTDLIIIPAIHGDPEQGVERNRAFIPWMVEQHRQGAELMSFCVGAYLLAATGLLRGKQCATHWMHVGAFRNLFPDVYLVEDSIVTDAGGIYTSGGAYSALNLVLYLIEKYAGRDIAILTAKTFMIDIDRHSQSPFIIFQGQREHGDGAVRVVQDYIEAHYQRRLTVEHLAALVALERRTLERRFRKATGNSVVEYMQRVRIEGAKKRLETGREPIVDVMYDVGYSDVKAFRTVFKKSTGMSPLEYRNKYNKDALVNPTS